MKKFTALLVALLMVVGVAAFAGGCGTKADFKIGIIQLVQHESLDKSNAGFQSELKKLMTEAGKTVAFVDKNASGEISNCTTISNTLVSQNPNLVLAIATPAALALKAAIEDTNIPMLFTSITNPADPAAKLVDTLTSPGGNITGTSDMNDVASQIRLAHMLAQANTKAGVNKNKIGFLYCTGEPNSKFQLDLARDEVEKHEGWELEVVTVNDNTGIITAMGTLATRNIGALYIPTDNTIVNSGGTVKSTNEDQNGPKFPIVFGEADSTAKWGVATYGVDYNELGKKTARQAFEILMNNKKPKDMPVEDMIGQTALTIYENNASRIGYTIPDSVKALLA